MSSLASDNEIEVVQVKLASIGLQTALSRLHTPTDHHH